jgi:hypothetical protein
LIAQKLIVKVMQVKVFLPKPVVLLNKRYQLTIAVLIIALVKEFLYRLIIAPNRNLISIIVQLMMAQGKVF